MPRRLVRHRRRGSGALVPSVAETLARQNAVMFTNSPIVRGPSWKWTPADVRRVAEAWQAHGAAILEAWIGLWPGTRPWAWWEHDAPEHRRIVAVTIDGKPAPLSATPTCIATREHRFGVVGSYWGGDWPFNLSVTYETEAAYLARLDLLAPEEAASLAASPRPESWGAHVNRDHLRLMLVLFPDDPLVLDHERLVRRSKPRAPLPGEPS